MWVIGLGVLGAILGSFIAACVIRWPAVGSVLRGRSRCDACSATLRAHELVPLLSWTVQRGRCRHCGAAIPLTHPVVELTAAAVGASAGFVAPGGEGVAGAVFGWLLLALAALDWRAFWLPDALTAPLAVGGLVTGALGFAPDWRERLIGGVAGFALLWLVAVGYRRWRGKAGLGGGDPKLFGGIGLWLGWPMLAPVILIAGLLGLGVVLVQRLRGRAMARTDALPLGTLLAIAAYPAWLVMVAFRI